MQAYPPPSLVFLVFPETEIAGGHYMPPSPGRVILRPSAARVLMCDMLADVIKYHLLFVFLLFCFVFCFWFCNY